MTTPKAAFASHLLRRPVTDWIADRRAAGRSWRQIVVDLDVATGGVIRAAPESVRSWAQGNEQDTA